MVEPNNTYSNDKDYEDELKTFLESDFTVEDVYNAEGEDDSEAEGDDDDFYGAEGENDSEAEGEDDSEAEGDDDCVFDMDFSKFDGEDFKSSLSGVNREFGRKKRDTKIKSVSSSGRKVIVEGMKKPTNFSPRKQTLGGKKKPIVGKRNVSKSIDDKSLSQEFVVKKRATLYGKSSGKGQGRNTKRIIVPSTQKVIVEGVDKFILGKDKCGVKDIGYYKCRKLRELVFTMNNNSGVDFNLELFNPSMPLDYLFSTSGNLNNKIQVAGGIVSYSDVLFNILANPTHVVNAKFTFAGATFQQQINQPLIFKNKRITGEQKVEPLQLQLQIDNMQVANDIVFFDILGNLNRPFIPNGMDIIQYKVLAGNTVTFAFYYEQKDLRKFFFKEARDSKKLI
jgi:hypothetical protein